MRVAVYDGSKMPQPKGTGAMGNRVFISHASQDHAVAEAVCDALETRGVPCWIAPRDITPGKEYAQALYDAIVECRALLLVLSANAAASTQVRREIEQAARDGDPIIAFRIDDCEPGPALEFHIGRVDWLAPSSVDLAAQIGALASMVQAQLTAGAVRPADVVVTSAYRAWRGYAGVLRRLLATWTTALILTSATIAAGDCLASVVALYFARQDARAEAARAPAPQPVQPQAGQPREPLRDENASPFKEEDPVERITALSAIQLIVMFPIIFVWLAWVCSASLTVEHAGVRLRHPAGRAPGRFMWRLVTFRNPDVLRDLWLASVRVGDRTTRSAGDRVPRRLWPFTLSVAALLPLTMFLLIVSDEHEWSDPTIFTISIVADLVWLAAAVMGLLVLKPIERRLRLLEVDLKTVTAPQRSDDPQPV